MSEIRPIIEPTQIRSSSDRPHAKYDYLIARAKQVPAAKTVVVHPCDETSLRGAAEAAEIGIITPILVGPATKITAAARQHKIDIDGCTLVDAPHSDEAAAKGVELIREGRGELLMKGSLHTDELMRAVTFGSTGLRTARRDQSRVRDGRSLLRGGPAHHRRRHQHLSRS
jgi:phosphate acetyltransferase